MIDEPEHEAREHHRQRRDVVEQPAPAAACVFTTIQQMTEVTSMTIVALPNDEQRGCSRPSA